MAEKKGSTRIAMARQGTSYADPNGRFKIAWPWGREHREVLELPHEMRGGNLERHIADGSVIEVDDEPNVTLEPTRAVPPVFQGLEARARRQQPPPEGGVAFSSYPIREPVQPPHPLPAPPARAEQADSDGLDGLRKADLEDLAETEGVDLSEAKNNAERVAAIRAAREA